MIETIRTRGNISTPGEEGLTNPILKIKAKPIVELLIE
jgi:hypothetical protein